MSNKEPAATIENIFDDDQDMENAVNNIDDQVDLPPVNEGPGLTTGSEFDTGAEDLDHNSQPEEHDADSLDESDMSVDVTRNQKVRQILILLDNHYYRHPS